MLIPRRLTRQPTYAADIDWGHPSAGDLSFLAYRNAGSINLVSQSAATTPVVDRKPSIRGDAWPRGVPGIGIYPTIPLPVVAHTTLCVYGDVATGSTNGRVWVASVTNEFVINKADGRPWIRVNGTNVLNPTTGPQVTDSANRAAICRVVAASYADAWWDGARQHTATHAATPGASKTISRWGSDPSESCGDVVMIAFWARELTDDECADITLNPWQLFKPRTARIYSFPSAGGSLNVSATTDALTLAEYAATIGKDLNVSANIDSLTLAEHAATVSLVSGLNVNATTDALTLAEHAATIGLSLNVQATTDALTLAEYPASLGSTLDVQATTDALTLAEYPATLSFALNVSATTDSLTLVEYGATIGDGSAAPAAATGGSWVFPRVKRRDWREQSAKQRREYLERLLEAAEAAPEEVREAVEEILEQVTGQEDEAVNVARIDIARINRLITRIERAIQDEDDTLFLLMAS